MIKSNIKPSKIEAGLLKAVDIEEMIEQTIKE
jgi:hypothetical protein